MGMVEDDSEPLYDQFLDIDTEWQEGYQSGYNDGYEEGILFMIAKLEDLDRVSDISVHEFVIKMRRKLSE